MRRFLHTALFSCLAGGAFGNVPLRDHSWTNRWSSTMQPTPGVHQLLGVVLATAEPVTATNLTTNLTSNRVVLEGDHLADTNTDLQIPTSPR